MTISREEFAAKAGRAPVDDDLERCNCPKAGVVGHYYCGWCSKCDKPRLVCGHVTVAPTEERPKRRQRQRK